MAASGTVSGAPQQRPAPRLPRVRLFRQLQWRLTFSYAITTVIAFLLLEAAVLWLVWLLIFRSPLIPSLLAVALSAASPQIAPALEKTPPDTVALERWLDEAIQNAPPPQGQVGDSFHFDIGTTSLVAIIGRDGRVLTARPEGVVPRGQPIGTAASQAVAEAASSALAARPMSGPSAQYDARGFMVAAAPVFSTSGQSIGAIVIEVPMGQEQAGLPIFLLTFLLPSALFATLFALAVGTLFGFLTARRLTRRLRALSTATNAWSAGDFSQVIQDRTGDELTLLAHQLNHTAEQLRSLLQSREQLASLEERNRLARDLHDSVKQQIFATGLQVAAARSLLERDVATARTYLDDAERLVRQAQQELTGLIHELRPAALDGRGLAAALRDYVTDWSRQHGVATKVSIEGERALPPDAEGALFRICQEALANVARHSGATSVEVQLTLGQGQLVLTVRDNGKGFDSSKPRRAGVGLRSMGERAAALGGSYTVQSAPGAGTTVAVRCPV